MIANKEFPEAIHHSESAGETYLAEDVDEWFKRCMSERPNPKDREYNLYRNFTNPPVLFVHLEQKYWRALEKWEKKWFSQFRNNKE